jgi:hypothetical protein
MTGIHYSSRSAFNFSGNVIGHNPFIHVSKQVAPGAREKCYYITMEGHLP